MSDLVKQFNCLDEKDKLFLATLKDILNLCYQYPEYLKTPDIVELIRNSIKKRDEINKKYK